MSDAKKLLGKNAPPRPFRGAGLNLTLGHLDLDGELTYQAIHESWARNRIEATRSRVSPESYENDLAVYAERRDSNRYAFGTQTSTRWLLSPAGAVEYVTLCAQAAGQGVTRERIEEAQRDDAEGWYREFEKLVREDFPNLLTPAPAQSSGETGTQKDSTRESSSSSAAPQGTGTETESAA